MESSLTAMTDGPALVADTSAIINLNSSGCAAAIIGALPYRVVVVDSVLGELESGRLRGRRDADLFQELLTADLVQLASLEGAGLGHFEELVVGTASQTLDDGEAATIAHAASTGAVAVVDERKAMRICADRFPELRTVSTVDLFAHPTVGMVLGSDELAEAVFNALLDGRMRVFPKDIEWVVTLIGSDRAARCASLPYAVRIRPSSTSPLREK